MKEQPLPNWLAKAYVNFPYAKPLAYAEIDDERYAAIIPLTFARARIIVGKIGDATGYQDGW